MRFVRFCAEGIFLSELVPIYKGKGDVLECSSSRGIKLLEHGMKVAEKSSKEKVEAGSKDRQDAFWV